VFEEMSGDIILIDKPSGITSYDVIRILKKKLDVKKIGHTGTLDPLASGLLIVLTDEKTKEAATFSGMDKQYRFGIRLGIQTDTGDTDGKQINSSPVPELSVESITKAVEKFIGNINQVPPMYSAVRYKGKKLYQYARAGISVDVAPRNVVIKKLELIQFNGTTIELRTICSKGTYVRSLAESIAEELGTCGCVEFLVREKIGNYSLKDAMKLPENFIFLKTIHKQK